MAEIFAAIDDSIHITNTMSSERDPTRPTELSFFARFVPVAFCDANRWIHGPPSLTEALQVSPSFLSFPYVFSGPLGRAPRLAPVAR